VANKKSKGGKVTFAIVADTPDAELAARQFMNWLCNSGEQQYWMGMEHYDPEMNEGHPKRVINDFTYDFSSLKIVGKVK
jgi:hypothetical protein